MMEEVDIVGIGIRKTSKDFGTVEEGLALRYIMSSGLGRWDCAAAIFLRQSWSLEAYDQ